MAEKEKARTADAKRGMKDHLNKFKGAVAVGRKAILPVVLGSALAMSHIASTNASAQVPLPTPTIDLIDTLNSTKKLEGKDSFARILRLASKNRNNELFAASLDAVLETVLEKAKKGIYDSVGATSTKFSIYGDSGSHERSIELSPMGKDGVRFVIAVNGDTAVVEITPKSTYDDISDLHKKLCDFFNYIVGIQRMYKNAKPSPLPKPGEDLGNPIG
jgi:hypothetical protein